MARAGLVVIALAIGVAVSAAVGVLCSLTGRSLPLASYINPVTILSVAIPYLCLAFTGARRLLPWLVGIALTLSLKGYYLYSVIYPDPNIVGANIGLGIMMLGSPFFISPIVLGVHALQRRATASR